MFPFTDYVLIFTVIITTILAAPLLGKWLRIPDLVLLLVAGAALGSQGFGVLERNEAITLFGEIGLLYIMFLAGLEIDLYEFSRTRKRSIGFGIATFLLPQVGGAVAVYFLVGSMTWASAILMASMFASHTLLAYPVASKLGIQRMEPVTISVGATIVTDSLALLVLAVIVDSAEGVTLDARFWAGLVLALVLLVLAITLVIPRLARWFFQHVSESGGTQFLFVLAVVCAAAYFSQFARMKPLIGAFLAGAALNRQIPENSTLMNRLEFVGNTLFIPFFLISVGMLVDPGVLLSDPYTWKVIGAMSGMVVLTKFLAAWLTGALFGYSVSERNVVFGLTVVQAAATLAAALVGFEAGILDEAALNGAIGMIIVTVPLGSAVVQRSGRKLALNAVEAGPAVQQEQRLLVAVHDAEVSTPLMELALLFRNTALPGGLFPLTIVSDEHDTDHAVTNGEKLLAQCINLASSADMEVDPHVRVDLNPSDGIVRAARELRASSVLVGWGRGSRFLGGVQEGLIEACTSRVVLCLLPQPLPTNKVLRIPFPPLSEYRSDLATLIQETKGLAKQAGLDVHVYLSGPSAEQLKSRFEKTAPGCELAFTISPTWKESRQTLFSDCGKHDLLVLPQSRKNTALWTPTLDRLPEMLVREFPHTNLLIIYPELRSLEQPQGPVALPARESFPEVRGVPIPPGMIHEKIIPEIVNVGLPEEEPSMVMEAIALLTDSATLTPVELSEECVLLHAHCGERDGPVLLVGVFSQPTIFFDVTPPPRIVLALLSPKTDAPEIHLRSLAQVAKRFRQEEVTQQLPQAKSAEDVCHLLSSLT
jgi:Kef-type K+ transport system membrane component KefB